MDDKDWFWQDDSYKLDAESPLAISRSLWDGLAQSEADSRSLFATTPSTEIINSEKLVSTSKKRESDAGDCTYPADALQEGSPRSKRRRMLLFPECTEETVISDTPFDVVLDSSYGSNCVAMLPSEDCEKYDVVEPASLSSLWYLKNDDPPFTTLEEVMEPHKWMARSSCGGQGYESFDPTKLIIRETDIPGNCSEYQQASSCEFDAIDSPYAPCARSPTPGRKPNESHDRPKSVTPVAYPFALLKPCGAQGDVTLKDINQRISMPPSRPSPPHLGGDESRPSPALSGGSSGESPGLSGKSVVALTKIHTEGNGTITIMRTRG